MVAVFARWTPAELWLAGLLWADGHIVPVSLDRDHQIILNSTDDELIEQATEIIGPDHTRYPSQPSRWPTGRPLHRLGFVDKLGALAKLGFGPKPERQWPVELASGAFLRGLFDGDGSVGRYQDPRTGRRYLRAVMSSPASVLTGMQAWLSDQGIRPKNLRSHGNSWQVCWAVRDSQRLAGIMYADPGPRLARKQAVFQEHPC